MFSGALRRVSGLGTGMFPARGVLPVGVMSGEKGLSEIKGVDGGYQGARMLGLSSALAMPYEKKTGPVRWPMYNKVMFPPQALEEERRPAYVCHMTTNIHYSPWKMWYVTCLIRGMSIDEAIRQLDYVAKKGAFYVKKTLLEAQELAVAKNNVEFRSNLWVAESFCTKGVVVKGIRRHARKRIGLVEYFHTHYYVRLEEGTPPQHYYDPAPDGPTLLQRWIQDRREERVFGSV